MRQGNNFHMMEIESNRVVHQKRTGVKTFGCGWLWLGLGVNWMVRGRCNKQKKKKKNSQKLDKLQNQNICWNGRQNEALHNYRY